MTTCIHYDHNLWEEGVFTMKNYFLYLNTNKESSNCIEQENIFCFGNSRLLAVDVNKYSNRNIRLKLQELFGIRPYYVVQEVFKSLLIFIMSDNQLRLIDLQFKDRFAHSEEKYGQLIDFIKTNKLDNLYQMVEDIKSEFDTDIERLVIRFSGYDFTITSEGLLDTDAPMDIFTEFIKDATISKLMLGNIH